MIDHVFLSVSDLNRSIGFYERTLLPLGITQRPDFDGKDGPPGHPDTLKALGATTGSFSGSAKGWSKAVRRMSVSSRSRRRRLTPPMPPRLLRAGETMANQVLGSITTRVTMPAMCSTPTATASNLFSRAGSTPSPNRQPCTSGPLWVIGRHCLASVRCPLHSRKGTLATRPGRRVCAAPSLGPARPPSWPWRFFAEPHLSPCLALAPT